MEEIDEELQPEAEENLDAANIKNDVAVITGFKSKIVLLKAIAFERTIPSDVEPERAATINKLEEELSRTVIHQQFTKTCLQSVALNLILKEKSETSQTIISLLKQYDDLLQQLKKVEVKHIKFEIMNKKVEYVDKLNAFKRMLEEEEEQRKASQNYGEVTRKKISLSKKLEKINIMRMLMLNIICNSHINYEENPEYSKMASNLLEPLTFKSLNIRIAEQSH